jgi:hypothetical protein
MGRDKHFKEGFLRIEVRKGAPKQEVIDRINEVLKTTEIPIFNSNPRAKGGAATHEAPADDPSGSPIGSDGTVMLMRQEGW